MDDVDRDRDRVEESAQVALVEHRALVLLGDVAEDDHGTPGKRRDAAVDHELAPVERGGADAEPAAPLAQGRPRQARRARRSPVEEARVEELGANLLPRLQTEDRACGRVRDRGAARGDDDAVGDRVEDGVEAQLLVLAPGALGQSRQARQRVESARRVGDARLVQRCAPGGLERRVAALGDERHANHGREALSAVLRRARLGVRTDHREPVAAEQPLSRLGEHGERLVEGGRLVDGDRRFDQLVLALTIVTCGGVEGLPHVKVG